MPRAVLFDLDGTLVDLPVDIEAVRGQLHDLFAPRGYGERFAPILERLAEASAQVATSETERVALQARGLGLIAAAELAAAQRATPVDGACQVVEALTAAAVPVGIVTNNGRDCVAPALDRLGCEAPWRVVVSRDDAPAKPDPSGLIAAARAVLPAGGTLWFVGDGDRDIAAARAADAQLDAIAITSVGLLRGGNAQRLAAAAPDVQLADVRELLAVVGLD